MASYSKEKNDSYMPQLDILRSVAIIAVILFHAKTLGCGYLGVDVFLVISGFLFVHSIKKQAYSFSPFNFAQKRIGRILPSMMAVCFITLSLTIFLTSSGYTLGTARQTFSDLLFYGNVYQDIAGGGYMDRNPFANPLMHLWYLQVLIQITVFLGFLELLKRYSKKCYAAVFFSLFLLSFLIFFHFRYEMFVHAWIPALTDSLRHLDMALSSVFGRHLFCNQDSGYLWTLGRYWMFMSGILCYRCYVGNTSGRWWALFWLFGVLTFLATGRYNVLAVAATGSIILAGRTAVIRRIAEWSLFKQIGKYAFDLYLTHWPVLSLAYTVLGNYNCPHRGIIAALFMLVLTPPLTYLLYRTLESRRISGKKVVYAWVVLAVFSYSVCLCSGFKAWKGVARSKATVWDAYLKFKPVPAEHPIMKGFSEAFNYCGDGKFSSRLLSSYFFFDFSQPSAQLLYFVGAENCNTPTCLLVGDSHMQMYKEALHEFMQEQGVAGVLLCSYVCPFVNSTRAGAQWGRWDLEKYNAFFTWLARHPEIKTVYLNQSWCEQQGYMILDWNLKNIKRKEIGEYIYDNFGKFARRIRSMGKNVYVFTPALSIPDYSDSFYKELDEARLTGNMESISIPHVKLEDYLTSAAPVTVALNKLEEEGVISLLHAENTLFENGVFVPFDEKADYMNDAYHLSPTGAKKALRGCEAKLLESIK